MEDKDCINEHCEFYDEAAHQNCGGDCGGEPAIASCKHSQDTEPPDTVASLRVRLALVEQERDETARELGFCRAREANAENGKLHYFNLMQAAEKERDDLRAEKALWVAQNEANAEDNKRLRELNRNQFQRLIDLGFQLEREKGERERLELVWHKGQPPKHYGEEWFIAQLTDGGGRVVLKALPEEYSYDYKTADETYFKAYRIAKWMQFPDSQYIPFMEDKLRTQELALAAALEEVERLKKHVSDIKDDRDLADAALQGRDQRIADLKSLLAAAQSSAKGEVDLLKEAMQFCCKADCDGDTLNVGLARRIAAYLDAIRAEANQPAQGEGGGE